jgi:hypothetical protein
MPTTTSGEAACNYIPGTWLFFLASAQAAMLQAINGYTQSGRLQRRADAGQEALTLL